MKRYILITTLFLSVIGYSQNGINYKALIKDDIGNVIINSTIQIKFIVLQGDAQINVYEETQSSTTDLNGIIIVNIGEGTVVSGIFNDINWEENDHFLNVKIDTGSGFIDMGTTQFSAVPYAFHAKKAANVTGLEAIDEGNGIGWRLTDRPIAFYGDIGENAVDLSYSNSALIPKGALGINSFATGFFTEATGDYATSMGFNTEAAGDYSTSLGFNTETLGDYSFASGRNSSATGNYSTAIGYFTIASSPNSISMGSETEASGLNSIAIGNNVTASGAYAIGIGQNTIASGENATAFGRNTEASGDRSVAMGSGTEAQGNFSFAFGDESEARGNNSIAMGDDAFATSDYAVAIGRDAFASGVSAIAIGNNNEASGNYSISIGSGNEASGSNSTAFGLGTEASGIRSTAMGQGTMASWGSATAMGSFTQASNFASTAMGDATEASGYTSTAMGDHTIASARISTAIGSYNIGGGSSSVWIGSDPLFEIGNGRFNTPRSNALTVLKNGNVGIGTHTPQELLHISGGRVRIGTETIEDTGNNRLSFDATLLPNLDDAMNLGNSSFRWNAVWSVDGTINTSDRREKKNIKNLNYGLAEILQMQPVSFNWKNKNNPDIKLGLIAQDLLKLTPEVVKTHVWEVNEYSGVLTKKELDRLGVHYSDLVPVLIKAIQDQNKLIENQEKDISQLKSEVSSIKDLLTELKITEQ